MKKGSLLLFCLLSWGWRSDAQTTGDALIRRLKDVPVLCYHQVREWQPGDSRNARVFITPPSTFRRHMEVLFESGFHTIMPEQLRGHLLHGNKIPHNPIIICFDDGTESQLTNALPQLEMAGFKAVFFIMTVTIGKPGYLSSSQIRSLAAEGHIIGCHTWDHHDVRKYTGRDWTVQLKQPTRQLEALTGKPIGAFAYPFGAWNRVAIPFLQQEGYTTAFQLAGRIDTTYPLYTIPRILVNGYWTADQLLSAIRSR